MHVAGPAACVVCKHERRAEIEAALLDMTSAAPSGEYSSVESIAEQFGVPLDQLKMHALFHTPLVTEEDAEALGMTVEEIERDMPAPAASTRDSLTRRMKLREADMLECVANEYLVTLKSMGRRIQRMTTVSEIDAEDEDKQFRLSKMLTKPMVDLYIGVGGEIRQTVKTMAEVDRMLNGPEDNSNTGLAALAKAIQGSGGSDG